MSKLLIVSSLSIVNRRAIRGRRKTPYADEHERKLYENSHQKEQLGRKNNQRWQFGVRNIRLRPDRPPCRCGTTDVETVLLAHKRCARAAVASVARSRASRHRQAEIVATALDVKLLIRRGRGRAVNGEAGAGIRRTGPDAKGIVRTAALRRGIVLLRQGDNRHGGDRANDEYQLCR